MPYVRDPQEERGVSAGRLPARPDQGGAAGACQGV